MAFFEDLSRKVQDVAFAAAEKGKEVAAIASEKAQDAADTVKTNVAIAGEQRAIEKNYRAIGEWYVSELKGEAPEAVADIVAAIRASQARIAALQGEDASAYAAEVASVTDALKSELAGELKAGLELRLSKKVRTGFRLCAKDGSGYFDCSEQALAEMLLKMYADPEKRNALGRAAAERSLLFDEKTIHARMKEIYFGEEAERCREH